jgi:DNA helicase-2/ATP-dependent DNA helicase PcrA
MLEAIDSLDSVSGLSAVATERLSRFRTEYRELLTTAQGVSLVELCRRILDHTGAWAEIDGLPDAARLSARLNTYRFLDLAEDWSPLEGGPSLDAFLDHLDALQDESSAEELDTARVSGENAVVLLTVHRAKGLEWPVVYLPALVTDTFPSRVIRFDDPMTDPFVLPYDLRLDRASLPDLSGDTSERKDALRTVHADGEWRTAYVAVTRAADELIATGSWWYTAARPRTRSTLFEIINRLADSPVPDSDEPGEPPQSLRFRADRSGDPDPHFEGGAARLLARSIDDPALPRRLAVEAGIADQYDAAVDQLHMELDGLPNPLEAAPADDRFRTSVTGLVTFAGCSLRFRWEHLERLPRRPSIAARRGVELHRRIELFHRGTVAFDEAVPDFYDDADDLGGTPTASAFDRFSASRFASQTPILIETPFELDLGDAGLSGRIDAVYAPRDDAWEIVDFKSGRVRTDPATKVQLEAYAVAAREAGLTVAPPPDDLTVTFAYFGGDRVEERSEKVDDAWLDEARRHLLGLMEGAAAGPYVAEPGERCRSCDFTRFCSEGATWLEEHS